MNSTSRVRPVRSLGGFGRGAQQGAGRFRLGGTCRRLAVVRVLGPVCSGAPLGFFGGFRSRTAQPPRSGCILGWYWRSRARCAKEISTALYLTQILKPDLGHTRVFVFAERFCASYGAFSDPADVAGAYLRHMAGTTKGDYLLLVAMCTVQYFIELVVVKSQAWLHMSPVAHSRR